ncbi:hypothetical protein V7266_20315 [Neobacillus drentensis]|uniref:hypothetical protein n=1 Tax=Neobacillus drentensis TaxID=220684 RepID=UPI002FFD8644
MGLIPFPFVLAGPIVRRVECGEVYIWMATSRGTMIDASIYEIETVSNQLSFAYHLIETNTETSTIRAGKQLYFHLIKVTPAHGPFPTETLIGYNLHFTRGSDSLSDDLQSLHYLSPENQHSIVYGNLKYPAFMIKNGTSQSNILYGSCRKLHGEGQDTLALADQILEREYQNTGSRPDSLFLMGDQIYADDVAAPLILAISIIGRELIGHSEPLAEQDVRLGQVPYSTTLSQINGRQFIMENIAQFTSSQSQNHLIELGEFAAMYLLSWNPELWAILQNQHLLPSFEEAEEQQLIHFTFPNNHNYKKEHKLEREKLRERYLEQQEALITLQESLTRVRRLLANIPTYMIFDDHDITDDWNLSAEWKMTVNSAPLGKHVVANGLCAYWLFQGWGNEPDSFDSDFMSTMTSYFKLLRRGYTHRNFYKNWLDILWNFNSWHYVAPTHPKAVFLDTRTMRDYDTAPKPINFGHIIKESEGCPQLLNQTGWSLITSKLENSGWKNKSPLLVVSATPVYGMGLIESFLHDFVYPFQVVGVKVQTSFDFEAWKYNGKGFTEFLTHTSTWNPSPLIILSGDVHYASAVKATVTFANQKTLPIYQFTSSPFKNMSFSGVWGLLMKMVIAINAYSRKRGDIFRTCTTDYTITHTNADSELSPFLWKDQLRYQSIEKSSIIETTNNLGLVSFTEETIQNQLIRK